MTRVAVDATCLAWGWSGIPRYVRSILTELARREDLEVTMLANAPGPLAAIPGVAQVHRRVKSGPLWRNAFLLPWLARHRPDVFWSPEALAPLWTPVPHVVTVHDLAAVLLPGVKSWRQTLAYRTSVRRSAKTAARVITVSSTTAWDLERTWGVAPERVGVIPNGVDDRFTPGNRQQALARVSQRWSLASPFALFVGTLERRKGVEVVVAAAGHAQREGAGWHLVLAGSLGHRGEEVVKAARGAGNCTVLGAVSDDELVDLYRAAEALVAPSLYEGFGITPLEAMACGTPAVIAGASGGLEETSGTAAIVVRERSPQTWSDAIVEAMHQREELARRGLDHAARFRWPAVAVATGDLLVEAAQSRAR